jgi:hypothetical protein
MRRTVRFGRRDLDLKPREFGLLEILARHPGQVFTRAHLLDCVWPRDYDGDEPVVVATAPAAPRPQPGRARSRRLRRRSARNKGCRRGRFAQRAPGRPARSTW